MPADYHVKIETRERSADFTYVESDAQLVLSGEFGGTPRTIFFIYAPDPEAWDIRFPWAAGRREDVLRRIGAECVRQKCRHCSYLVHAGGVDIIDESAMKPRLYRWLALLPPVGMLGGVPFVNREQPLVLGLPPLMAWIILWILLTPVVLGVIYALDHARDS